MFQNIAGGTISILWTSIALIAKPKTSQEKKTTDQNPLLYTVKIPNKILIRSTPQNIERVVHHDWVGFIPETQGESDIQTLV